MLPLVCVGIVGNDGGLFTHQHSQVFYGLAFFLSVILLIPMYMHMYTVMLRSIVYYASSALLNIISEFPVFI